MSPTTVSAAASFLIPVSNTRSGVRASAGSGKTYELTNYYLRSLMRGASPRELLATTFTRKAAGEILGRVLLRLCDACQDQEQFDQFTAGLGVQNIPFERGRELLLALCSELHQIKISTIDSFFAQMLRSYCHDLGISADLRIVEENAPEVERIRNEAIRRVLSSGNRQDLLKLLDTLGTGRAKRAISSTLAQEFEKAHEYFESSPIDVWQQKYSVRAQLTEAEIQAKLSQLESWAATTDAKGLIRGVKGDVGRAFALNWSEFLEKGISEKILKGEETFSRVVIPPELREIYHPLVEHAAGVLLEQHESQTLALRDALLLYHEEYRVLREQEGILLFRDVPLQLSRFMATLTPEEIAHRLDTKIDYLLLDEFQDTAPQQYAILQPFARQIMGLPVGKGLVFCVGDLKQSIYGWRGATPEVFARMEEEFPQLEWSDSDQSYRSSPIILDAVNQVFGGLVENAGIPAEWKTPACEWSAHFNTHRAVQSELSGYVEVLQSSHPASADSDENGISSPVNPHLEFAAQKIAETVRAAPHATVGVLLRRNNTVTEMIYLLRKLGIAATGEAGSPLADDPAVALILSALRFSECPGDKAALFHLLNSPLAETLRLRGEAALEPSQAALELRRAWHANSLAKSIAAWAKVLAAACDRESALCLEQLIQLADQYSQEFSVSGEEFIVYVRKQSVASSGLARIRVMTVHKSKGLEFDMVFLPELHRPIKLEANFLVSRDPKTQEIISICKWPNKILRSCEPVLEKAYFQHASSVIREAFCALYVAMTRAKRALYILVPALNVTKKGVAGKPSFSAASIVRAGLSGEDSLSNVNLPSQLYAHGNPFWYQAEKEISPSAKSTSQSNGAALEERFSLKDHVHIPRSWQRISPSVFEEGTRRAARELLRRKESDAAIRGTVIHELFSRLEWSDQDAIDTAEIKRIAQRIAPEFSADAVDECVQSFRHMLKLSGNRKYLELVQPAPNETIEVWRERRFAVYVDEKFVVGAFDRVLVFSSGGRVVRAEIIDFKTGNYDPSTIENYRVQMTLYQEVLQKQLALPAEKIRCHILFVEVGISREI